MANRIYYGAQEGTWHSGADAPAADLGVDGDFYFDTLYEEVFQRINGTWTSIGLGGGGGGGGGTGATGPTGATGATGPLASYVLSPAYSSTVTVDLTSYSAYRDVIVNVGTLTGDITFNITNGFDGQIIRVRFKQDGTGSRVFTAGANLRFSATTPYPTLTTTAGAIDRLGFEWHATDGKADLVAINKAYL